VGGEVVVDESSTAALDDIDGFERIWLIWQLNRAGPFTARAVPYRNSQEHGLFATWAPSRPKPIGVSVVPPLGRRGNVLRISGVDILDGTPLWVTWPLVADRRARLLAVGPVVFATAVKH
jgi:tRNA (Thr-GGU) A37 N-methylase